MLLMNRKRRMSLEAAEAREAAEDGRSRGAGPDSGVNLHLRLNPGIPPRARGVNPNFRKVAAVGLEEG